MENTPNKALRKEEPPQKRIKSYDFVCYQKDYITLRGTLELSYHSLFNWLIAVFNGNEHQIYKFINREDIMGDCISNPWKHTTVKRIGTGEQWKNSYKQHLVEQAVIDYLDVFKIINNHDAETFATIPAPKETMAKMTLVHSFDEKNNDADTYMIIYDMDWDNIFPEMDDAVPKSK